MATLQEKVGRAIQRRRKEAGVSQEVFAAMVGVHRAYMGAVERGEKNLTLRSLERIAKRLHLKVSDLLADAEADR